MAYFDGVKIGDRVWDFKYGWGTVTEIYVNDTFEVDFDIKISFPVIYTKDGIVSEVKNGANQTLFWDEIKFEIPKSPKIKLRKEEYLIDIVYNKIFYDKDFKMFDNFNHSLTRSNKKIAEKALKQIKIFARLLALRDQECPDSRGYEFIYGYEQFVIFRNINKIFSVKPTKHIYNPTDIYFKTKKDAQKVCDILNKGKFDLEGE